MRPSAALSLAALLVLLPVPARAQTGQEVPEMANYDAFFPDFLQRYGLPGAAVAVMQDGRLVYARGFGMADVDAGEAVEPDSRFRIASLSKPVTAVVAMKLYQEGRLDLDAPAFAFLDDLPAPEGKAEDPRLAQVTLRHLLTHAGGWDRDGTGYDPMFDVVNIAAQMGVPRPADTEAIIRYMRGRPLDFDPGAKYAYSNFGYAVLGRVLERIVGEGYEPYVQGVLAEAGIADMQLGHTLQEERLPGEVTYYPLTSLAPSVFDGSMVPWPYGGYYLEAMDAHGGWVASPVDLMRFVAAVDGRPNRPDLLTAATLSTMSARPDVPTWNGSSWWYAFGWLVNTNGNWWHAGSLPGAESLLVRSSYQGLSWAVCLNARTGQSSAYMAELDNAMWTLAAGVTAWPTHDLFGQFVADEAAPAATEALRMAVAPNPSRGTAAVLLDLPAAAAVRLVVYDVLGRRVGEVQDGPLGAGPHRLGLDGLRLAPGVYEARVTGHGVAQTERFTVVR